MPDQTIDQQSTAPASKTEKGMLAPAGSGGLRQMLRAKRQVTGNASSMMSLLKTREN